MARPAWILLFLFLASVGARADDMDDRVQAALELGDPQQTLTALKRDVRQGNLKAAHELGMSYLEGRGVAADPAQAREWFEEAAAKRFYRDRYKLGYAASQFQLGHLFDAGIGVPRDTERAAAWYRRAAEQGHAEAQLALARIYADASSPPHGFDMAYFWAVLAAESRVLSGETHAIAQKILAVTAAKLGTPVVNALRRKAAAWSPVLFADH